MLLVACNKCGGAHAPGAKCEPGKVRNRRVIKPKQPPGWNRRKHKRKEITARQRALVKRRDGMRCRRCGKKTRHGQVDHIVALSKGGSGSSDNLQWLCTMCHKAKTRAEGAAGGRKRT